MKGRSKNIIATVINIYIVISLAFSVSWFFVSGGSGNMSVHGTKCFMYFTMDSNILMAVCSAICLFFNFRNIRTGENSYPSWMITAYHAGTNAVTLTLIVVLVFLGPAMSYSEMFEGINLYMHLINPVAAIASFVFLVNDGKVKSLSNLTALLPTLIYGAVYFYKVIILGKANGGWSDFYGFNTGGFWYISIILVPAASFGFGVLLRALHNKIAEKN